MRQRAIFLSLVLTIFSMIVSACSGLLPLPDEPAAGEYGPAYSAQEHQMRAFDVLWDDLQNNYIYYSDSDVNWDDLYSQYTSKIKAGLTEDEFTSLMKGLETDLPDGSLVYQSRAERVEADIVDSSTYDGIGAFVGFQEKDTPHIVILAVIEGSPAAKAGLKAHDSIFSIDGSPILLEEGLGAVSRIRGPAGSSVTLNVQSPGEAQRSVEVTRAKLTTTGRLNAYMISGTEYGYLLFPPINYQGLDQDVSLALQTLSKDKPVKGLILDLRVVNASQGWPLDTVFALFHNGKIGELYNRTQKQPIEMKAQDIAGSQTLPLIILVGKNTGGFAEVFAASMQAYDRAVIVGEPTLGNVETQSAFLLPDGSRIFIESMSFRLANGIEIGATGITPDVKVEAGWDDILPAKDPVLDAGIAALEKTE